MHVTTTRSPIYEKSGIFALNHEPDNSVSRNSFTPIYITVDYLRRLAGNFIVDRFSLKFVHILIMTLSMQM